MKMLQNQRDEKLLCGKDSLDFRNSCYIICLNQRREIVGDTFLLLEEKSSKCELNKKKTRVKSKSLGSQLSHICSLKNEFCGLKNNIYSLIPFIFKYKRWHTCINTEIAQKKPGGLKHIKLKCPRQLPMGEGVELESRKKHGKEVFTFHSPSV